MMMLEKGPAAAMRNSVFASGGSSVISATPPKIKRVMPFIGIPLLLATREWQNSWTIMERNSPSAPTIPIQR